MLVSDIDTAPIMRCKCTRRSNALYVSYNLPIQCKSQLQRRGIRDAVTPQMQAARMAAFSYIKTPVAFDCRVLHDTRSTTSRSTSASGTCTYTGLEYDRDGAYGENGMLRNHHSILLLIHPNLLYLEARLPMLTLADSTS